MNDLDPLSPNSADSQRRLLVALALAMVLTFAYTYFFSPQGPPPGAGPADAGQMATADAGTAAPAPGTETAGTPPPAAGPGLGSRWHPRRDGAAPAGAHPGVRPAVGPLRLLHPGRGAHRGAAQGREDARAGPGVHRRGLQAALRWQRAAPAADEPGAAGGGPAPAAVRGHCGPLAPGGRRALRGGRDGQPRGGRHLHRAPGAVGSDEEPAVAQGGLRAALHPAGEEHLGAAGHRRAAAALQPRHRPEQRARPVLLRRRGQPQLRLVPRG